MFKTIVVLFFLMAPAQFAEPCSCQRSSTLQEAIGEGFFTAVGEIQRVEPQTVSLQFDGGGDYSYQQTFIEISVDSGWNADSIPQSVRIVFQSGTSACDITTWDPIVGMRITFSTRPFGGSNADYLLNACCYLQVHTPQ